MHSRIKSLANLRLPRFAAYLKKLCLRQNLISHLDPDIFHQLTLLEELDLYDNRIRHIHASFDKLQGLKYVFYRLIDARVYPRHILTIGHLVSKHQGTGFVFQSASRRPRRVGTSPVVGHNILCPE